jgi:sugar phosphate isomerase/epimerase
MKLAISGTEFSGSEPMTSLLAAAEAVGVTAVEVWYPKNFEALGERTSRRVLERSGIDVACISTATELGDPRRTRDDRAVLNRAIDLAVDLQSPFVNTYFGFPPSRDDDRWSEEYASAVTPCLERASERNVRVVLENEFNAFGLDTHRADITRRPAALAQLIGLIGDDSFGINFDAANFYCADQDPLPAYRWLRESVAYAHAKDVAPLTGAANDRWRTYEDYGRTYETRPMGSGVLPWPELLAAFRADGLPVLTVEPHACGDPIGAFRQAVQYVRNCPG